MERDAVLPDGSVILCVEPGERHYEAVADAVVRRLAGEPVGKAALALAAAQKGVSLAQVHAPHAVEIGGVKYRGGEFIPQGASKMAPEAKAKLLGEEHVRADDEGNVLAHFPASAHQERAAGKPGGAAFAGDKDFRDKVHDYLDRHMGRVADAQDGEAARGREDADQARDDAEQAVHDVVATPTRARRGSLVPPVATRPPRW